jgi:hypothetical protein
LAAEAEIKSAVKYVQLVINFVIVLLCFIIVDRCISVHERSCLTRLLGNSCLITIC